MTTVAIVTEEHPYTGLLQFSIAQNVWSQFEIAGNFSSRQIPYTEITKVLEYFAPETVDVSLSGVRKYFTEQYRTATKNRVAVDELISTLDTGRMTYSVSDETRCSLTDILAFTLRQKVWQQFESACDFNSRQIPYTEILKVFRDTAPDSLILSVDRIRKYFKDQGYATATNNRVSIDELMATLGTPVVGDDEDE